jgi:hypothetical protein
VIGAAAVDLIYDNGFGLFLCFVLRIHPLFISYQDGGLSGDFLLFAFQNVELG